MPASPLFDFRLSPADFRYLGSDLRRPEGVLALHDGSVLAACRGRVATHVAPDGVTRHAGSGAALANTFALDADGTTLVADLERGAVLRMGPGGRADTLYDCFDDAPLGAVNFIMAGEVPGVWWLSVSSRDVNYRSAIDVPRPDGRILRIDADGLTLAADGLFFPNAMQIDPVRGFFYVIETTAGRVARATLDHSGRPGAFQPFGAAPLYPGAYPDGLALDQEGNVWITELSRNALLLLNADGAVQTVFDDPSAETLRSPTGLAFGGSDLRTVFVGSLKMTTIPTFRAPIAGLPMRHWRDRARPGFF